MGISVDLSAVRAVSKKQRKKTQSRGGEQPSRRDPEGQSTSTGYGLRIVDDSEDSSAFTLASGGTHETLDKSSGVRSEDVAISLDVTDEDHDDDGILTVYDDPAAGEKSENESLVQKSVHQLDRKVAVSYNGEEAKNESNTDVENPRKRMKVAEHSGTATSAGEVIYRDMDGFVITKARWLELQAAKKGGYKVKREEKKKTEQKPVVWGKGLQQEEEMRRRQEEEKQIALEPLARYEIDSTFDRQLKEAVRWDDPLRHLSATTEPPGTANLSGPSLASSLNLSRPKCRFTAPSNRFGIQAGYRWDGVVRGTGYESRYLQERNKKDNQQQEAYKWSIEDM